MAEAPSTFAELLRRWPSAVDLSAGLAAHGCTASDTLIRRWWNEEMLPAHAWRAFVALSRERGFADINLELLAKIAEVPAPKRREILADRRRLAA